MLVYQVMHELQGFDRRRFLQRRHCSESKSTNDASFCHSAQKTCSPCATSPQRATEQSCLGCSDLDGISHQVVPIPSRVRHRHALISKEFLVEVEHERGCVHRQCIERAVSPVLIEHGGEEFLIELRLPGAAETSRGSKSPFSPHHRRLMRPYGHKVRVKGNPTLGN